MLLMLQDYESSGLENLIESGALVLIVFYSFAIPLSPGGLPYVKRSGMLVVHPRGVNHGFWSHLGNSEQNTTILCHQGIFNLYSRRNTWSFMTISLGSIFRRKHLSIIKIVETHTYKLSVYVKVLSFRVEINRTTPRLVSFSRKTSPTFSHGRPSCSCLPVLMSVTLH